jgi:hypothetical protein
MLVFEVSTKEFLKMKMNNCKQPLYEIRISLQTALIKAQFT